MARRQVTININGEEVAANIKQIYREKRKLNAELNSMVIGTEEYIETAAKLRNINGVIKDHRDEMRGVRKSYDNILAGGLSKLAPLVGAAFATDTIIHYGRELFRLGAEMEVLGAKAETVFGRALPLVTQEAERNANAMGFTISQYTDAAAAIGDLLVPMGFQREEAANISTQLVNLSGALSEWTGGQISAEQASSALSKALLGEREELKTLGIAISEADVQNRLRERGLEKLTGKLLEQAKATATLELVLEKSTDAQAAFANNSDTLVRRQAEISAKVTEVSEKLATALLPVFERLVDVADRVATGLLDVTDTVTALLDPVQGAARAFDEQAAKVNTLEGELAPLLDRYEELTSKTSLTNEEQDELAGILQKVGDITPSAITQVDEYGRVLGISADAARELIEVEKARLEVVQRDAIALREREIKQLQEQQQALKDLVETGKEQQGPLVTGFGSGIQQREVSVSDERRAEARRQLEQVTRTLIGTEAELARLRGDNLQAPESPAGEDPAGDQSPTEAEIESQKRRAESLRQERQKQAEKELQDRMRQLELLEEVTRDFAERERLARLSDDERTLEEIRLKYEEQIAVARALEEQGVQEATDRRIELERLQAEELARVAAELHQKKLEEQLLRTEEEIQAEIDAELEKNARLQEVRQQIKEFSDEVLLTERELTLLALQEQYDDLIALAQQYGLDTADITRAYRERLAKINEEYDQKDTEQLKKAQAERARAIADSFGGLGDSLGGLIDLVGDKTQEAAEFSRILALAQIATKTAEAIANGVAAATAAGPFPLNLAAIGTTVATVLANIATARKLLSETPVPQGFTGGLFDVRGQQDGRRYRAQYIGRPGTGLLPGRPVLLASEKGPEYLVANEDLRNPMVLDYVRAIENIRRSRLAGAPVRQYAEGGFTETAAQLSSTTNAGGVATAGVDRQLMEAMYGLLLNMSENGVQAVLEDDLLVDTQRRIRKLSNASGGVI